VLSPVVTHSTGVVCCNVYLKESQISVYRYITFILGTMHVSHFLFNDISYDIGVNQGAHIFPSGNCITDDNLVNIAVSTSDCILKSIQIVLFLVYFYYKYQLNKDAQSSILISWYTKFLLLWEPLLEYLTCYTWLTSFFWFSTFLATVFNSRVCITTNFLCTKKIKQMCKEYISKD